MHALIYKYTQVNKVYNIQEISRKWTILICFKVGWARGGDKTRKSKLWKLSSVIQKSYLLKRETTYYTTSFTY